MNRSRVWLAVTALSFAAWIGYLVFLTRGLEKPPIHLSHPQFQIAEVVIVAHVNDKAGPIAVTEVVFPADAKMQAGDEVQVRNLRNSFHKWLNDGGPAEWDVPNDFIIPLRDVSRQGKDGAWTAEVVPLPPSPGSPQGTRVYPVTPNTLKELHAIPIGAP